MGCVPTKVQAAEVVEDPVLVGARAPAPSSHFPSAASPRVSFTAGRGAIQPVPSTALSARQLSRMRHAKLDDFKPIRKLGQGAFGVVLLVRLSPMASELRERETETHVLDETGRSLQVAPTRSGGKDNYGLPPGAGAGVSRTDAGRDSMVDDSVPEDEKEEALFAMKVMAVQDLVDAEMVTRVVAEKDILQRLHHPFIVRLHFAFMSPKASQVFLVMEAVLGGELFAMMARLGFLFDKSGTAKFDPCKVCGNVTDAYCPTSGTAALGWLPTEAGEGRGMPESWVRFYTAEIACALFHLHRHGVLYRDLKPENVMLRLNGHIALTDFGLAMDRDEEEGQGEIAGTLPYLAPDMLGDDLPTEAVDWWSLGFLMHEMMWGRPPFGTRVLGANENQLQRKRREQMRLILFEPLVLPGRGTLQKPSDAVCDIVRRLLIRDCRKRLGSGAGAELAQAPRRRSVIDFVKESVQSRPSRRRHSGSHDPRVPESEMLMAEQAARRMAARMEAAEGSGQVQQQLPRGKTMIEGRGFHEIEGHPFFGEVDMRLLLAQVVTPPWLPSSTHQSPHAANQMSKEMAQRYTGVGEDGAEEMPTAGEGEGSEEREADLARLRADFRAYTAAPVTKLVVQDAVAATKARGRRQSAPMVYTGSADTKRLRLTQVF